MGHVASEIETEKFDIVIRGGRLIDGTGAPSVAMDVAISGERITAIAAPDRRCFTYTCTCWRAAT